MPLVIVEGPALNLEGKRKLVKELTNVAAAAYGLPAVAIDVVIRENALENLGHGGQLLVDAHKNRGG